MAAAEGGETRVLAKLDDGEPLLAMRKVEEGRVLMLGTGVHVDWTNLPLRPIFLPLMARLTFELSGIEQARHTALAGAPLVLKFENASQPMGVEVLTPLEETMRLMTTSMEETEVKSPHSSPLPTNLSAEGGVPGEGRIGKGQIFRYADTYEIGIYLLRPLDAARAAAIAYAVNLDPEEEDPANIEREELHRMFGTTPLFFADNPDDLSSTFAWLREGKSLWGLFLAGVLAALVFETLVSNLLSPKQN